MLALERNLRVLHARTDVDLRNIQTLFGIVEMGSILGRLPGYSTGQQIEDTRTPVRTVLAETMEYSGKFMNVGDGPQAPEAYHALLSKVAGRLLENREGAPDVAFGTLNYDVRLYLALALNGFDPDYGLQAEPIISGKRVVIPLLKLLGSLNWSKCQCGAGRVHAATPWPRRHRRPILG